MVRWLIFAASVLVASDPAAAGWEEGVAAWRAGDYARAAEELQEVLTSQPDHAPTHFLLGQALEKLGRREEALGSLQRAQALDPQQAAYALALGRAYLDRGDDASAVGLLAVIEPGSLPVAHQRALYELLAVAYSRLGEPAQALSALGALTALQPDDARARLRYGLAASRAGDIELAASELETAAGLAPGDADIRTALVRVRMLQAHRAEGEARVEAYRRAVVVARELAAAVPSYANLLALGQAELGTGDYRAATETLDRASAEDPREWLAAYSKGQAHALLGEHQAALEAFAAAMPRAPADETRRIWRELGRANERLERWDEARDAFREAGDEASVARVEHNRSIEAENRIFEEVKARLRELDAERGVLERLLEALAGGAPPPG
jgi:tetratricopeptide (TPR) repeat protein